jgi:hypothetical protein
MKILILLASVIGLCATAPQSFAQIAGALPPPTTTQPRRLPELTLGKGSVAELPKAIELLAKHLRDNGEEVPNVILGAGTEQMAVPTLTLRNISGLDALQMIATAAGCELDRVGAADDPSRAAGWLVRVKAPPPPGTPDPFAPNNAFGVGGFYPGSGGPPTAGNNGPLGTIVSFGAPSSEPSGALTMVYPVGGLLTEGKASDAMSALEDALKVAIESAGLAGEKPRLSFHEKTKVLIIKGSQELQQLVGSFLDALEKNRASASAGELAQAKNEIARSRETADLREREMSMQLKRLEVQISELDSERRALRRHAEELEAKLPKTGPPAENPRR